MKRIFIVTLLASVAVSCNSPQGNSAQSTASTTVVAASIAYLDIDRVVAESDLFAKEGMPLQQRAEAARRDWAQKEQAFQNEAAQLQQKYQKGLITSANAQKQQQDIESRIQTYQTTTQKQAAEIDEENTVFANRTQLLLRRAVDNVNADGKYSMIINAATLIDADTTLDISTIVLAEFNNLYKTDK